MVTVATANIPLNAILSIPRSGSFPERIAEIMGDRTMNPKQLAETLAAAGDEFPPIKAREYLAAIFLTARTRVIGPDGQPLLDSDRCPVKAHRFVMVARGTFRVATLKDVRREVLRVYGGGIKRPVQ